MRTTLVVAALVSALSSASPAVADQAFELVIARQADVTGATTERTRETVRHLVRGLRSGCGPVTVTWAAAVLPATFAGSVDASTTVKLRRFRDTESSVQLVPGIWKCGSKTAPPGLSIGGCAPENGPVLVRWQPETRKLAQKMGHEMGHAQGLIGAFSDYVDGHSPATGGLMFFKANEHNWSMSPAECARYYRLQKFPPPQAEAIVEFEELGAETVPPPVADEDRLAQAEDGGVISSEDLPEAEAAPPADETEVEEFLHGDWFEDPFTEIDARLAELLPRAEQALDEEEILLWPGAVTVIAYAGAADAEARLRAVLDFDPAALGPDPAVEVAYALNEAKIRAAGALSYIVYRDLQEGKAGPRTEAAFDRLNELSLATNATGIAFAEGGIDPSTLAEMAAMSATSGLGLVAAESEEAREVLESRRRSTVETAPGADAGFLDALIDRAGKTRGKSLLEALTQ